MTPLKPPMLIDAIRLTAKNRTQTIDNIIEHYSTAGGGWNHQRCLRPIMHAYNGADDSTSLIAGCKGSGKASQLDNSKIVEAVLPKVIGRQTQCFPYKRRHLALTPTIHCAMGPSFFIVEGGVIKLVYVHARNKKRATLQDIANLASVLKSEILDQEFYGEFTDVEIHYVNKKGNAREDTVYNLERLSSLRDSDPMQKLSLFATCLVTVMEQDLVKPPMREKKKSDAPTADNDGQIDFGFP
jgi:hypothetical protein